MANFHVLRRPRFLGTYVVAILVTTVMALIVLPGDIVSHYGNFFSPTISVCARTVCNVYSHGWPREFECSQTEEPLRSENHSGPDWLTRDSWKFLGNRRRFQATDFAFDIVVAIIIVALASAAYEKWRSRRNRIWQFTLVDGFVFMAICGSCFGYCSYHLRIFESEKLAAGLRDNFRYDEVGCRELLTNGCCANCENADRTIFETRLEDEDHLPRWIRKLTGCRSGIFRHKTFLLLADAYCNGPHHDREMLKKFADSCPLINSIELIDIPFDAHTREALPKFTNLNELIIREKFLCIPKQVTQITGSRRDAATGQDLSFSVGPTPTSEECAFFNLYGEPTTRDQWTWGVTAEDRQKHLRDQVKSLAILKDLPHLQSLELQGSFNTELLRGIGPLTNLKKLHLRNLFHGPKLWDSNALSIVTDEAIYPHIEQLEGVFGSAAFAKLKHIKGLIVHDTLDQEILDAICDCDQLEFLEFQNDIVSERDFDFDISKLVALRNICKFRTLRYRFSEETVAKLQTAWPRAVIEFRSGLPFNSSD